MCAHIKEVCKIHVKFCSPEYLQVVYMHEHHDFRDRDRDRDLTTCRYPQESSRFNDVLQSWHT
jgi:hypothetical protein